MTRKGPDYQPRNPGWSEAEQGTLRKHWKTELSAEAIAALIPGRSRAAVIGQARRLGLGLKPESSAPHSASDWTEAERTILRQQWQTGASLKAIANLIPGRTHRAVGRQAHALGLGFKPRADANPGAKKKRGLKVAPRSIGANIRAAAEKAGSLPTPPRPAPRLMLVEGSLTGTLGKLDLKQGACAWPIGDPQDGAFSFCGRPTTDRRPPYCAAHRRMAFTPVPARSTLYAQNRRV
ncbi:cell cycle regulator [Bajunvirus bajun]|uniref:Cell cycle regulator n=1 Tax=Brevundimonas phage vB_BgoS-Bajun TaxID=2948594 RepID=A0A9E7N739_9CAUD|nr:cell cycle regulator [Brevundimonas phage vB_BgoS-Bajun]